VVTLDLDPKAAVVAAQDAGRRDAGTSRG